MHIFNQTYVARDGAEMARDGAEFAHKLLDEPLPFTPPAEPPAAAIAAICTLTAAPISAPVLASEHVGVQVMSGGVMFDGLPLSNHDWEMELELPTLLDFALCSAWTVMLTLPLLMLLGFTLLSVGITPLTRPLLVATNAVHHSVPGPPPQKIYSPCS